MRISTIESTSPLANFETLDSATLPAVLVPSEPPSPDRLFEQAEVRDRGPAALAQLPSRERKILGLYYFGDATMKQIGKQIGVNESRVSQLHARAIQRLRKILTGAGDAPARLVQKPRRAKMTAAPVNKTKRRLHESRKPLSFVELRRVHQVHRRVRGTF